MKNAARHGQLASLWRAGTTVTSAAPLTKNSSRVPRPPGKKMYAVLSLSFIRTPGLERKHQTSGKNIIWEGRLACGSTLRQPVLPTAHMRPHAAPLVPSPASWQLHPTPPHPQPALPSPPEPPTRVHQRHLARGQVPAVHLAALRGGKGRGGRNANVGGRRRGAVGGGGGVRRAADANAKQT